MEKDNLEVDIRKFSSSCQSANLDVDDKSLLEQINRFKITALFFTSRKRVNYDLDALKYF